MSVDKGVLHSDMFVSVTLYSINHMDFDIKGMNVLPRRAFVPIYPTLTDWHSDNVTMKSI